MKRSASRDNSHLFLTLLLCRIVINDDCLQLLLKNLTVITDIYFLHLTIGWKLPPKLPLPWGPGPSPNTRFFGPTQVHNPNGVSIGSTVFVALTIVINR